MFKSEAISFEFSHLNFWLIFQKSSKEAFFIKKILPYLVPQIKSSDKFLECKTIRHFVHRKSSY